MMLVGDWTVVLLLHWPLAAKMVCVDEDNDEGCVILMGLCLRPLVVELAGVVKEEGEKMCKSLPVSELRAERVCRTWPLAAPRCWPALSTLR